MNNILFMRQLRAQLYLEATKFFNDNKGSDGKLSESDERTYDKMMQEIVEIGEKIRSFELERGD